jgi:hypothetical protein
MIEIGDLIEYDSPHSSIKSIGIVVNAYNIGGWILTVNFGDYEDIIFSLDNIRKIA